MSDADSPLVRPPAPAANGAPAEAPLVCRICRAGVPPSAHEDHLQRVHGLYAYRGVHASRADTLDLILDDLLAVPPAAAAWQALVRLVRSEPGDAGRVIGDLLVAALAPLDAPLQLVICGGLAPLLAPGHLDLLLSLARRPEPAARQLALFGLVDPSATGRPARRAARALLADDALGIDGRCRALAALLTRLRRPGKAREYLLKLARRLGKTRALAFFGQAEQRLGPHPDVAALKADLEARVRMSCPRCGAELRQPQMRAHLWREHRLLLDGLRVRDPWAVVEGWLDAARASGDPGPVARCRVAADKIDPAAGQRRLARALLARGLADGAARRELLAEAAERHAGCCPRCFAFVAVPPEAPPLPVRWRASRLVAGDFRVGIDESGLRPWLTIDTPTGRVYEGVEPGRSLTADGGASLAAGAVVLVALLFATLWPPDLGGPLRPVLVALAAAWLVHWLTRLGLRVPEPPRERVLRHAWTVLVPRLHAGGFDPADSAFAAGLAGLRGPADDGRLADLVRLTAAALGRGEAPPGHLAALLRLQIDRAADLGDDPVALTVRHVGPCFEGQRPLALAQHLLDDWTAPWWTRANRARLRILLCDQAFEAGFEVATLLEAGQTAPALGAALGCDAPRSLAALRLLWSLRPARPWDRLGAVRTAFELAAGADGAAVLTGHPDVLLWQRLPGPTLSAGNDAPSAATVLFTLRGVWVQGELFMIPPRVVEVLRRGGGTEMILGRSTFRSADDLEPLTRQLERWFRWAFHEFLPRIDGVPAWPAPDQAALLHAWGAVPCPECGLHQLPRRGAVGAAAEP